MPAVTYVLLVQPKESCPSFENYSETIETLRKPDNGSQISGRGDVTPTDYQTAKMGRFVRVLCPKPTCDQISPLTPWESIKTEHNYKKPQQRCLTRVGPQ